MSGIPPVQPSYIPAASRVPRPIPGAPFDIGQALSLGWQALTRSYGMLLAIVAINLGIGLAVGLFGNILALIPILGPLISLAITIFFSLPMGAGVSFGRVEVRLAPRCCLACSENMSTTK